MTSLTPPDVAARLASLRHLVGRTPLIEVACEYRGRRHRIYGKYEALNFTGSIKDRMALTSLAQAYASGEIEPGDAICMAQKLATELGIALGISSGANFLGALQIADQQGADACVATIFCDDNKKYLSTDLCSDEECKPHYMAGEIALRDFRVIPCS